MHIVISLPYIWNPNLCPQHLIVCLWQNFTRLHGFYDITKLQQRVHNTQSHGPNFALAKPTLEYSCAYIYGKCTWCWIWIVNDKFFGYLSTFRSALLSQHCWGNHSQVIVPSTCQLCIDTYLASTSPLKCRYVYDKMGIYNSTLFQNNIKVIISYDFNLA